MFPDDKGKRFERYCCDFRVRKKTGKGVAECIMGLFVLFVDVLFVVSRGMGAAYLRAEPCARRRTWARNVKESGRKRLKRTS